MVFGIIATVIVMGMLFVFAIPQFSSIFGLGGQAHLQKTVKDIESMADEMYALAMGSSRLVTISLSPGTRICFINPDDPGKRVWEAGKKWKWWTPDPVVEKILTDPNTQYYGSTLWIYSPGTQVGEGYTIKHLKPAPQYDGDSGNFCVDSGRQLYFESKGSYVEVSTA